VSLQNLISDSTFSFVIARYLRTHCIFITQTYKDHLRVASQLKLWE